MISTRFIAAISAVLLALAGCAGGGESEPRSEPEPTGATPTGPPPQPKGPDGITWEIQNWDQHFEDDAVLTWKAWNESISASVNTGEVLAEAREHASSEVLDLYVDQLAFAADNDLRSQETTLVRIAEVEADAEASTVIACIWSPSAELVTTDGELFSDEEPRWVRQVAVVEAEGERQVLTSVDFDGNCNDEEPPP